MRRVMLLLAAGTLWLFLAAIPAFADGGPHNVDLNSGFSGLTADGCAGCHRAHTAKGGEALLVVPEEELCQSCHGPGALGATTNVWNGVQFDIGADASNRDATVILGALRNGGFLTAAIGADKAAHLAYIGGTEVRLRPKVPVNTVAGEIAGESVTSVHMNVHDSSLPLEGTVWGNGTTGAGATTATLDCSSCHNVHGNGNYRILVPIPQVSGSGNFVVPTTDAIVTDAPAPGDGDARNYTVIQTIDPTNSNANNSLYVSQIAATNVAGDYMHRYVPWNATATGTFRTDNPNNTAGNQFNNEITAWCTQCHTRYSNQDWALATGDPIFMYQHGTRSDRGNSCVTCHVGHGSNAAMTGDYSAAFPYPDDVPAGTRNLSASSRLLKVDNRGTCQACHDPTNSSVAGNFYPAQPVPLVP